MINCPDKGSLGCFQRCFAVMAVYVLRFVFVETGYMGVCELLGFGICDSSTLIEQIFNNIEFN